MPKIILYTDGACSGNDQKDITKRKMIACVSEFSGDIVVEKHQEGGSNNIAELLAVKEALFYAINNGFDEVEIRTDSRNNFSWVLGKKVGKHINDRNAVLILKTEIAAALKNIKLNLEWTPRESNLAGRYLEQKYAL